MQLPTPDEKEPASIRWMKRGLVGFVGFALLLGFYMAYWTVMARQLQGGMDAWIAARAAEGIVVRFEKRHMRGFPGRLHMVLDSIEIVSGADGTRPWQWRAKSAEAWAAPWRLGDITYALRGPQRLQVGQGAQAQEFLIANEAFGGEISINGPQAGLLNLLVPGLAVDLDGKRLAGARRLDVDLAWNGAADQPFGFDVGIDGADMPARWATPLGRRVSAMRLSGHVSGALAAGALQPALTAWRDSGGTMEITRFAVEHGPLALQSNGTAALDADLQPEAAFSVRAEGYLETVDALVRSRIMSPGEGTAAKLVLTVIAKRPAGQTPYVETPLTLQGRELSAGDIRIARLPPIDWARLQGINLPAGLEAGKMGP